MGRALANSPGDRGSIPGRVIPKTQKMVIDVALLNTQYYEVRIKGNGAIQGQEQRASLDLGVAAFENGAFESLSTKVANFTYFILQLCRGVSMLDSFKLNFSTEKLKTSKKNKFKHCDKERRF